MTAPAQDGQAPRLSLGPVLFNWAPEKWRDFYFSIADEAPVDAVYVGEAVCSKRTPFIAPVMGEVVERLQAAGKEVVFSTLALVTSKREADVVRDLAGDKTLHIEANDPTALRHLRGRPHTVGPYVNVYNEETMRWLAGRGARRICLPFELPATSLAILGQAARGLVDLEVQAFGRLPLALSARCYHARAHHLHKDNCQFVCGEDPDGMELRTISAQPFLAVNGIQTMSWTYVNLIRETGRLREMGISALRLSPHDCDMIAIADAFSGAIDGRLDADEAAAQVAAASQDAEFSTSFFDGEPQMPVSAGAEAKKEARLQGPGLGLSKI